MKIPVVTVFFIAILLFISFHFLLILSPFSGPILFAAILAFAFYPLRTTVRRAVPNDTAASLITTLLVLAAVVPMAVWAAGKMSDEGARGVQWLTNWIREKEYIGFIDWLSGLPIVDRARSTGLFDRLKEGLGGWMTDSLASWGKIAASQAAQITKNVLVLALNAILAVFFFFVFLNDGGKIVDFFYRIMPLEEDSKKEVLRQMRETFAAVIHGQVLSAFIKSAILGITFWIMGLPLPVFFAAVTFFASLLPILGAAAVWFPFVVYLVVQQDFTRAGILFGIGAVPINLVDNIIQPLVIGQRSGLPYALLLLGVIGGMAQYGVFGIFIGPVVMSLFFVLIKIYLRQFVEKTA